MDCLGLCVFSKQTTKKMTHHQYHGAEYQIKITKKQRAILKSLGPIYLPRYGVTIENDKVTFHPKHLFPSNAETSKEEFVDLGQVQSHSTGNTSSGMRAQAGGNINYINYYGSNSATAWNPSAQYMDPEKFTKPIADVAQAAAGPALKSPSVEECGYSDRIMQLTAGNSSITTQEAANAVVAYGRWPEYYEAAAEAIDLPTKPGVSCDRFYTFDSFTWTLTSKAWIIHFPSALAEYGVFGQNLNYHYLYRSGFCFHIQCNASKFHQGTLLVAAIPEMQMPNHNHGHGIVEINDWADWPVEWPIGQVPLAPHQLINLRTNNSATIIYPFTCPTPASFGLSHDHVSLVIIPIVPLSYTTGASTNVPITVSVAPMCSQYSGLRNSLETQGVPVFEIPGSRMFSTVLRNSGFPLYPEFDETHGFENPGRVSNLLEVAQVGTFVQFQQGSENKFYGTIDVTNTGGTAAIFHWDMSFVYEAFLSTYLCKFARLYNSYRGSINFEFIFCGSAMATGKLLLAYTPPGGSQPPTRKAAMLGTHLIWDIGLQSTVKFTVPYISTSQFRYNAIDTNVLSLDGFISMFYQTAIVVPPGAPTTCQLICKMSAASNFCFRIPTDDAYFQGIGDDLQLAIQHATSTALQSTTLPAVNGTGTAPGLALTSGDSPALTAAETGSSTTADGSATMEVRQVDITFSAKETDLEYLYSRYFYMKSVRITNGSASDQSALQSHVVLTFNDLFRSDNTTLKSKFRMFTYWKFDLDVVIVPAYTDGTSTYPFEVMFVPYGSSLPANNSSALWNTTANPVFIWTPGSPPLSFRIPFVSCASAFASQFNGYSKFGEKLEKDYGFFPGNYFGVVFFRSYGGISPNNVVQFRVYVRPVNIKAWMPRPLISYKPSSQQNVRGPSQHRKVFVDEGIPEDLQDLGIRGYSPFDLMCDFRSPVDDWEERLNCDCYPVDADTGPYTMWRLKGNRFILPAHAMTEMRKVRAYLTTLYSTEKPTVVEDTALDVERIPGEDLVVFTLPAMPKGRGIMRYLPKFASDQILRFLRITINSPAFPLHFGTTDSYSLFQQPYKSSGKDQWNAYRTVYNCQQGHCGGLLHEDQKVHGILVSGCPSKQIAIFSILTRPMFTKSGHVKQATIPTFSPSGVFQPLGPISWFTDTTRAFGQHMGDGFVSEVEEKLNPIMQRIERNLQSTVSESFCGQIIKLIVKIVCGVAIIQQSYDRTGTIIALTAMLGIDLVTTDPFEWLKTKIIRSAKYGTIDDDNEIVEQGFTDWVKDFNAACTAAKGLDWLVEKISKFFDWLKSFCKKESAEHKKFTKLMDQWPEIMVQLDVLEMDPCAMTDYGRMRLCEKVLMLKTLCDKFGVERNFATSQVLRYAVKARKILSSVRNSRHEPVAMCVHGGPGTGKSLATEIIGRALAKMHDGQRPYSLPPDPKHFDGYTQQDVVIMDDVGQNPDGEDLSLFCQMVSSTNFIPPMADLESKGVSFTSKYVLCSSNVETLRPPTIAEPKALARRFFLDADIVLGQAFTKGGKLDVERAARKCTNCDKPDNFSFCTPMLCGQAMRLKDRANGVEYSLDKAVTLLKAEQSRRSRCLNFVDALFQGPGSNSTRPITEEEAITWLMSDWDLEQEAAGRQQPAPIKACPKEIIDLIRATRNQAVIDWCVSEGYMVPTKVLADVERKKVNWFIAHKSDILNGLAFAASLAAVVILLVKMVGTFQGAYTSNPQAELKKPLPRQVQVQGPDTEFINKLMASNLLQVTTTKGPYTGLAIKDNILVLPVHSGVGESILIKGDKYEVEDAYELCTQNGPTEILVVKVKKTEKWRDITKFFPDCISTEKACWLAMDSELFPRMLFPVGTCSPYGNISLSGRGVVNVLCYAYPTKTGQCGGVVCKAGKIVGMHIGGDGFNGYCAGFKRSFFSEFQGQIVSKKPAAKSIHISTKTSLFPSVFHDIFPGEKEPAALSKNDKRLEVDLEEAMFGKYKGNVEIEAPEIDIAVSHYVEQIRPLMPQNLAEPLTLEEVVYGTENLDALDLDTSAGFPYVTIGVKKRDLIPPKGEPLTKLQEALDLHGTNLPFVTYLKDELRPIEKVKKGKTRLIEASSLNDTIQMKMMYGRLFQVFHKNPGTVTGSAVGCNPDEHWSRFYAELGEDNIVAFDYSNFDASLGPMWFDALKKVLAGLGLDPVLIDRVCNSTHIYRNIEYEVIGGMPSGCSGTSIFNSIINNIIIRTLVLRTYKYIDLDKLRIVAYGDDVLVSYPFPLDPALLAEEGKKFGLTMTPADKASDFDGVKKITEVTFLKRSFVPDEDFPFLIHPVFPEKEIFESIRWTRSASHTQEHVRSLCELMWHAGRAKYEDFIQKVRSVPIGRVLALPSYDYLRNRWLDLF
uniref:Genome polyprotein n=1 Tax=Bat picornavirus TaxID=1281456 RepID=A0A0D3MCR6_9PICO|nr:polyprotein [Bat picornavirus]